MLQDYSEGTGSAAREAEKSANNWEGSMNKLHNTWTDIVGNVLNSDAIVATVNCYYTSGRSEKQMRIKIHRKDINTVYFK